MVLPHPSPFHVSGLIPSLAGASSSSKRSWTGERTATPPPRVGGFPAAPLVCGVWGGLHYSSPWNIQAAGQRNEPVRAG